MGRAYAQDPQGWKRPWGLWGVGLRLKEQKGPRRAPHPHLRAADLTWEPSRLPGLEWAVQTPSSPLLLLLDGPSRLPPGPTRPGWGFGWEGSGLGAQQAPLPEWARRSPSAPLRLFLESPSHLPLLISLGSGVLILSAPLLLPPWSPYILLVHFGVPPISLGVRVPTSGRQMPYLWGDAISASSHTTILTPPLWLFFNVLNFLALLHGLQDLSSPTQDLTWATTVKALNPNH